MSAVESAGLGDELVSLLQYGSSSRSCASSLLGLRRGHAADMHTVGTELHLVEARALEHAVISVRIYEVEAWLNHVEARLEARHIVSTADEAHRGAVPKDKDAALDRNRGSSSVDLQAKPFERLKDARRERGREGSASAIGVCLGRRIGWCGME